MGMKKKKKVNGKALNINDNLVGTQVMLTGGAWAGQVGTIVKQSGRIMDVEFKSGAVKAFDASKLIDTKFTPDPIDYSVKWINKTGTNAPLTFPDLSFDPLKITTITLPVPNWTSNTANNTIFPTQPLTKPVFTSKFGSYTSIVSGYTYDFTVDSKMDYNGNATKTKEKGVNITRRKAPWKF